MQPNNRRFTSQLAQAQLCTLQHLPHADPTLTRCVCAHLQTTRVAAGSFTRGERRHLPEAHAGLGNPTSTEFVQQAAHTRALIAHAYAAVVTFLQLWAVGGRCLDKTTFDSMRISQGAAAVAVGAVVAAAVHVGTRTQASCASTS
jgi:hypothetical protein